MHRFITIFAIIMAIPTTLYVLYMLIAFLAVMFGQARMKIGWKSIFPIALFAACWAWILH